MRGWGFFFFFCAPPPFFVSEQRSEVHSAKCISLQKTAHSYHLLSVFPQFIEDTVIISRKI